MRRASLRQPLVISAVILTLAIGLGMGLFGGLALSRASNRAYRRAVRQELLAEARRGPGARSRADRVAGEIRYGVVTSTRAALGLDLAAARRLALAPERRADRVVVAAPSTDRAVFLVAAFPADVPTSIALVELSRTMPFVLATALTGAGLLALLVYRQLLPSLRTLAEVAQTPASSAPGAAPEVDAPNEIADIASRFRETTRMLSEARERAERQRDELERMQASLVRASKLASVGRLAAGVAHEIGNPLAAVKGYLALLQEELPEATRADVTARSAREVERIHRTIEQLLTFAREGSEPRTPPAPFALERPLEEALSLARGHPSVRDLTIEDRVPRDGLEAVGVADQVTQVLVNLLLNAGQATGGRGRVRLSRHRDGGGLELRIHDDGPGVPPEHREGIFDPFFTTKDPGEGTGLGLAVSRAMLDGMGGGLELRPTDRGACFAVRLGAPSPPD